MNCISTVRWAASFIERCYGHLTNSEVHLAIAYLREGFYEAYLSHQITTPFDHPEFPAVYQCYSLLKKWDFAGTMAKKARATALLRFKQAEEQCADTNRHIRRAFEDPKTNPSLILLLEKVYQEVENVIGSQPAPQAFFRAARFTKGTCSATKFAASSLYEKLDRLECSSDALDLASLFVAMDPLWFRLRALRHHRSLTSLRERRAAIADRVKRVDHNRVSFVPKNAKTDRAIAIEPQLNMFLQKGIGDVLRASLARSGINLNTQERNRQLARLGSTTRSIGTIDLAMASDTVSSELVDAVFPRSWVLLLNTVRSPSGLLPDGALVRYEKHSSMGNGYTFELESLLFYAIIRASVPDPEAYRECISVFGDDLIVPVEHAPVIVRNLELLGFKTNLDKTFISPSDPFRESCGEDYVNGRNIRPVLLSESLPDGRIRGHRDRQAIYKLANSIRTRSFNISVDLISYSGIHAAWLDLVEGVRKYGPVHVVPINYGADQGIFGSKEEFYSFGGRGTRNGPRVKFLSTLQDDSAALRASEKRRHVLRKRTSATQTLLEASMERTLLHDTVDFLTDTMESGSATARYLRSRGCPTRIIEGVTVTGAFIGPDDWL